jgi:hypothetical protein
MRRKFRAQPEEHWQEPEQHGAALALRNFKFERLGAHRDSQAGVTCLPAPPGRRAGDHLSELERRRGGCRSETTHTIPGSLQGPCDSVRPRRGQALGQGFELSPGPGIGTTNR